MPLTSVHALEQAALALIGVPWVHGQASQHGVDCVGFLVILGRNTGILAADYAPPPYPRDWALHQQEEWLCAELETLGAQQVPIGDARAGHIVVFRHGLVGSHAGVLVSGPRLVHASLPAGKVVAHGFKLARHRNVCAAYTFPGVVYV